MALSDNLQAYWAFDDTSWLDETSNNNDLTATNTPTNGTGILSNGVDLDLGDYLKITDAAQTGLDLTGDFTISLWLYFRGHDSSGTVLFSKWNTSGDQRAYQLSINTSEIMSMTVSSDGTAGGIGTVTHTDTIIGSEWIHVTLLHDGTNDRIGIRLNGGITQWAAHSGGIHNSSSDFHIGGITGTSAWDTNAILDEFGVWSRLLTPREQDWLYNYGRARSYANITGGITDSTLGGKLVSGWELNEASGVRYDYIGVNDLADTNTVTQAAGRINKAADFEDTNNEKLTIADATQTGLSIGDADWTISAWCNFESLSANKAIVAKRAGPTAAEYALWYNNSASRFSVSVSSDGTGGTQVDLDADTFGAATTGVWYHVVCGHDSTNNQLFIQVNNGAQDTSSHTLGVFEGTADFSIGLFDGLEMDGLIDSAMFFNSVLSADEITFLYNSGIGRRMQEVMDLDPDDVTDGLTVNITDGLAAAYELEEASGTRKDATVRGNDLTDNNTVTQGTGVVGNCADFELSNTENLSLANANALDLLYGNQDLSFVIWVNHESLSSFNGIIGVQNATGDNRSWILLYNSTTSRFTFTLYPVGSTSGATTVSADNLGAPSTSTWYMIYCYLINATNELGISVNNGTADTASHSGGGYAASNGDFLIGDIDSGGTPMDGLADQALVFHRVLSADEITWLYNSGSGRSFEEMQTLQTVTAAQIANNWWWMD